MLGLLESDFAEAEESDLDSVFDSPLDSEAAGFSVAFEAELSPSDDEPELLPEAPLRA
ncbi:MAG TPA: hypothetical protein VEW69_00940 [Alphaproteobacteria bacterium]|nr:hypothetical protein [Alphaproteobacteria bacterium]